MKRIEYLLILFSRYLIIPSSHPYRQHNNFRVLFKNVQHISITYLHTGILRHTFERMSEYHTDILPRFNSGSLLRNGSVTLRMKLSHMHKSTHTKSNSNAIDERLTHRCQSSTGPMSFRTIAAFLANRPLPSHTLSNIRWWQQRNTSKPMSTRRNVSSLQSHSQGSHIA